MLKNERFREAYETLKLKMECNTGMLDFMESLNRFEKQDFENW